MQSLDEKDAVDPLGELAQNRGDVLEPPAHGGVADEIQGRRSLLATLAAWAWRLRSGGVKVPRYPPRVRSFSI